MPRPAASHPGVRRLWYAAGLAVGATACAVVLPRLAGTDWSAVLVALRQVSLAGLVGLAALWLTGLAAYSLTLAAALPSLGPGRALLLNLTGSAVSHALPLGGAAGVALNYRMARSWGFDRQAIAVYTLVSNVWDTATRLLLPGVAAVWLLVTGQALGPVMRVSALGSVVVGVVVLGGALAGRRALPRLTSGSQRGVRLWGLYDDAARVVRRGWGRLTLGVAGYAVLTASLLGACLAVTQAGVPVTGVVAGFAVERLLTLVPLTPGGSGVVELGLTSVLLGFGGDPVGTVAGVLLYRVFTVAMEIPVGGVGVLAWLVTRSRRARARVV